MFFFSTVSFLLFLFVWFSWFLFISFFLFIFFFAYRSVCSGLRFICPITCYDQQIKLRWNSFRHLMLSILVVFNRQKHLRRTDENHCLIHFDRIQEQRGHTFKLSIRYRKLQLKIFMLLLLHSKVVEKEPRTTRSCIKCIDNMKIVEWVCCFLVDRGFFFLSVFGCGLIIIIISLLFRAQRFHLGSFCWLHSFN